MVNIPYKMNKKTEAADRFAAAGGMGKTTGRVADYC
jgi:hypothetical protein